MRKLFLHIGHPKTGSSYIQSSLALATRTLEKQKIVYAQPDYSGPASEGKISSGNGALLEQSVNGKFDFGNFIELYSSEALFTMLLHENFQSKFAKHAKRYEKVEVLLFIRDPVSYACSKYQQAVKRDGYTGDVTMWMAVEDMPCQVKLLMIFLASIPNLTLSVHNYSSTSASILRTVEGWLQLPAAALPLPPIAVINRSMTFPELEAQRMLNAYVGASGHLLADYLCNELPAIMSDDVRPSISDQKALWERLQPEINWVNQHIPADERYSFVRDIRPPTLLHDGTFKFSDAQFRILMREFARPHDEAVRMLAANNMGKS